MKLPQETDFFFKKDPLRQLLSTIQVIAMRMRTSHTFKMQENIASTDHSDFQPRV